MSSAFGEVIKGGKVIAGFVYNGTSDVARNPLFIPVFAGDMDWFRANWPEWKSASWTECTCGKQPIDVYLRSDYAGGFWWDDRVCLTCRAIVHKHECGDEPHHRGPIPGMEDDKNGKSIR